MTTASRTWLFCDYSQAESRVVAWRGPVPKLKEWYLRGDDVHLHVTHLIACVIQETKLKLPGGLFTRKPWNEYKKGDEEREQCKRVVHGSNYEMGDDKLALILNVPIDVAKVLSKIYHTLFPEIKGNYHKWIQDQLKRTKTLVMPEPVRFVKTFYEINNYTPIDSNTLRAAYATYPQSTIGMMLANTLEKACNVFKNDESEQLKEQWCVYYGRDNYDRWRRNRDMGLRDPQTIRWSGMDVRLNVHDAGGISIPDDPDLIRWGALTWRGFAEVPIIIEKGDELIVPVDFKKGKTWGSLEDYKLAAA